MLPGIRSPNRRPILSTPSDFTCLKSGEEIARATALATPAVSPFLNIKLRGYALNLWERAGRFKQASRFFFDSLRRERPKGVRPLDFLFENIGVYCSTGKLLFLPIRYGSSRASILLGPVRWSPIQDCQETC